MKKLLSILSLALAGCASGQTLTNSVTFTLTDWLQTSYLNRPVTIQGVSTPRTNPPYIAINFLLNTNSGSTGAFTLTNVLDGTYRVTIAGAATPTAFSIYVPTNQGVVHSASSLLTTSIVDNATTAYTKAQANSTFASRAGTNIVLTTNGGLVFINSTASGGGGGSVTGSYAFSAVYPLTNNTVSTNIIYGITNNWSNLLVSAAGALATNQVTVASNALQSAIDGKTNRFPLSGGGITISSATTNGIAFDVFTVAGTGGTNPTNLPGTGLLITTNNANSHTFTVDTNTIADRGWVGAGYNPLNSFGGTPGFSGSIQAEGGAINFYSGADDPESIVMSVSYNEFWIGQPGDPNTLPWLRADPEDGQHPVNLTFMNAALTTVSNQITNAIVLAGANVTVGDGLTNGVRFFTVNGASGSGGTAPTNIPGTGILITTNNANSHTFTVDTNTIATRAWAEAADTVSSNALQAGIDSKTNAVLLAGTNISLGDGLTNGVRFFTLNQSRPLPLGLVAGPVTNDVVAATNMSVTVSFPYAVTLAYATVSTREAPVTTGLILDVNTNGVSIFSNTNKLTVSTGTTGNTNSSFNSTTIAADVRITVDVDQAPGAGSGRAPTAMLWYYPQ